MTSSGSLQSNFFTRAFTAVAILGPMLLVIVAGMLPEGLQLRGDMIVYGAGAIVAALAAALLLRAVYAMGFSRALAILASGEDSVPA